MVLNQEFEKRAIAFDANGNYIPGIHQVTMQEFEELFIKNMPQSSTRKRNLDGLRNFFDSDIMNHCQQAITKIWIDGSFCTNKENPNDIDGVIFLDPHPSKLEITNNFLSRFNEWHFLAHEKFYSDLYPIYDVGVITPNIDDYLSIMPREDVHGLIQQFDHDMKYWMGQFSFDRNRNPKGIFEIITDGGVLS
ncbi:hypothetical protein FSZ06_05675 [Enterococcus gallinarum]|uniref:DUF6932 family protein n=1 Tax=Enterococcus TaxID=1350 RepID=UPI000F04CD3D|nr:MULTISPECIES: hypothetical protein [Enterococcus]TXJ87481.1 hypothetical protein FSZ06_05675 [Enterococcus gallinarum]